MAALIQTVITGFTGRKYQLSGPNARAHKANYESAKAAYAKNASKSLQIEKLGYADPICDAFEAQGLTDDDAGLALSLLKNFYANKASQEEATMKYILDICEDVTGQA